VVCADRRGGVAVAAFIQERKDWFRRAGDQRITSRFVRTVARSFLPVRTSLRTALRSAVGDPLK